ncbi:MAG: glycosyltransferase family 9 protein [Thermodesulfovibrionales bacterium]
MRLFHEIRRISRRLGINLNEFDRLLKKEQNRKIKRILAPWNRGLGDIPLGLYAFIERAKVFIPDVEITFLTRTDLLEAFSLLEDVHVIPVPWWERGRQADVRGTLLKLGISEDTFDLVFDRINPTKWFPWQIGQLTPRLKWKADYDNLWRRFALDFSVPYIGAHISTETQQFYGYRKDWPLEKWRELFRVICKEDVRVILFGLKKDNSFKNNSFVMDLRGETGLLEMLSIIKNCCKVLIAPDGGILSIAYYLDVNFPITVISLWGDSHQGVLKQGVPSPNPGLFHVPLIGKNNDVTRISVEEVVEALNTNMNVQG